MSHARNDHLVCINLYTLINYTVRPRFHSYCPAMHAVDQCAEWSLLRKTNVGQLAELVRAIAIINKAIVVHRCTLSFVEM